MIYSTAKIVIDGIVYDLDAENFMPLQWDLRPPRLRSVLGHDQFTIGDWVLIVQKKLSIGARTQVSAGAKLVGNSELIIGEDVVVSYNAVVLTGTDTSHGKYMNDARPGSERAVVRGKVILEDGCFIGAGAIVSVHEKRPCIRIGKRAVVGAGSYINRDVPPNTVIHPAYSWVEEART